MTPYYYYYNNHTPDINDFKSVNDSMQAQTGPGVLEQAKEDIAGPVREENKTMPSVCISKKHKLNWQSILSIFVFS